MSYEAKLTIDRERIKDFVKILSDKLEIEPVEDEKGNIVLQDRVRGISILIFTSTDYKNVDVVSICPKTCIELLKESIGEPQVFKKRKTTIKVFVKTLVELYEKEKLPPKSAVSSTVNLLEVDEDTLKTYASNIKSIGSASSAPHELKVAYKILKNAKIL